MLLEIFEYWIKSDKAYVINKNKGFKYIDECAINIPLLYENYEYRIMKFLINYKSYNILTFTVTYQYTKNYH